MLVKLELWHSAEKRSQQRLSGFINTTMTTVLLTIGFLLWVGYRWLLRPAWFGDLNPPLVEFFDLAEWGATVTLLILWVVIWRRRHQRIIAPQITRDDLFTMSPQGFEHYVADLFRRKGYDVTLRGGSGDLGVDLEVADRNSARRAIVQCKRYQNTVGAETVRELYGTLLHERVAHGFLVTSAEISRAARSWAKDKPLTLIDGRTLIKIAYALQNGGKRHTQTQYLDL